MPHTAIPYITLNPAAPSSQEQGLSLSETASEISKQTESASEMSKQTETTGDGDTVGDEGDEFYSPGKSIAKQVAATDSATPSRYSLRLAAKTMPKKEEMRKNYSNKAAKLRRAFRDD